MCFHNFCVPETCACCRSSVHSLLLCDVFCQGVGFPEFPLAFPPLLLSIAEGFFGSSPSCCSIKTVFYTVRGICKTCRLFSEILILLLGSSIRRNTCKWKKIVQIFFFFSFQNASVFHLFHVRFSQMPAVPFYLETTAVVNPSLCLNFHLKESENPVSLTTVKE